jgi:NTE family protein
VIFFKKKRKTIGLALSGGAARGSAHIGVIKALIEHNIPIDYISGTSVGSLVAALYAANLSTDKMQEIAKKLSWFDLTQISLSTKGMVSSKAIENFAEKYIGKIKFNELSLPLAISTTDILTGETIILNKPNYSVAKAIRASCSFPGIYEPTKFEDRYLVDGGVTNNLPINALKEFGADKIIAVDIIPRIKLTKVPSVFPIISDRAVDLLLMKSTCNEQDEADIILTPVTENINSFQINAYSRLIELGVKAVKENINKIERIIK